MTDKSFWEGTWEKFSPKKVQDVLYTELFERYLKPDQSLECLEIGCFPGNFLIYFYNRFGYRVYGIDYFDKIEGMARNLEINGVNEFTLFHEDFMRWETQKKFDLVFSNGFIEHFFNYEEVLDKHIRLLKDNGILFVAMPNFRYLQYFLHRFFDNENLKEHNLSAMRLNALKQYFLKNKLRIEYLGYYGGPGFWVRHLEERSRLIQIVIKITIKIIHFFRRIIKLDSRFFSCYLVCIAKKINPG